MRASSPVAGPPWRGPTHRQYALWVAACAAAELLGIALGAAWWVAMDRIAPDPVTFPGRLAMLLLKALSGLPEGVVLGGLQASALRHTLYPRLPVRAWIGLTAALAVLGWGVGSAFAIFSAPPASGATVPFDPPPLLSAALAAGFGLLVGAAFGGAQALALRRAAWRAGWWVAANATGWALALPVIYAAASTGGAPQGPLRVLLSGLGSGLAAGLLLGAVTGLAFRHMPPRS